MSDGKLKLCAILLVVLNVVLLISLLTAGVIIIMGNQLTEMDGTFNGLIVKTAVSQVVEDERAFYEETGKITKVQTELQEICESGSSIKPAAHLEILKMSPEKGKMQTLQWEAVSKLSPTYGNVKYDSGGIIVPFSGYYYIYTTIRYIGNGTEELDFGRVLHNVLMKKASEIKETPTILMQNLQSTPTIRRGREAYTTSSLGATFFLQANSTVMVNSSLAANIDTSPLGSYFGLFLM